MQEAFVFNVNIFAYNALSVLIMNFLNNAGFMSPLGIIPEGIRNC